MKHIEFGIWVHPFNWGMNIWGTKYCQQVIVGPITIAVWW